jgi:hypothetical protein
MKARERKCTAMFGRKRKLIRHLEKELAAKDREMALLNSEIITRGQEIQKGWEEIEKLRRALILAQGS